MATPFTDSALQQLESTPLVDVAATLFAEAFRDMKSPKRTFREIHKELNRLYRLKKPGLLTGYNDRDYIIAFECTLAWERAMLVSREWDGNRTAPGVLLLRRGMAVRDSGDPLGGARSAIRTALDLLDPS